MCRFEPKTWDNTNLSSTSLHECSFKAVIKHQVCSYRLRRTLTVYVFRFSQVFVSVGRFSVPTYFCSCMNDFKLDVKYVPAAQYDWWTQLLTIAEQWNWTFFSIIYHTINNALQLIDRWFRIQTEWPFFIRHRSIHCSNCQSAWFVWCHPILAFLFYIDFSSANRKKGLSNLHFTWTLLDCSPLQPTGTVSKLIAHMYVMVDLTSMVCASMILDELPIIYLVEQWLWL